MSTLIHYLVRYGVSLVFLNVFAEQIGLPVPAVPTLIVAGALARNGRMSSTHTILLAAVTASLIADWIWFLLGRRYGYRILRTDRGFRHHIRSPGRSSVKRPFAYRRGSSAGAHGPRVYSRTGYACLDKL